MAAPRITVVVPIYDVEPYLAECLESVAHQTFTDLEVVMVDDGSTDRSTSIARAFTRRDPRFRLITQPNGGLGRARNTGADAARGEFLCFLDSDDKLAPNFCELLLGALDETGSDFATGNVLRFTATETRQAPFLARTFTRTRLATHVSRFRGLLVDRIVPNKLWRRAFWDEHGFRFPEGVVHEDVPVVVPAQFLARSVDVIAEHVYLYREREGADRSITQRRSETKMLLDRLTAVETVTDFLGAEIGAEPQRWYRESVVAEDLRYYLNVLDEGDDAYRQIFLTRVNAYLDACAPDVEAKLPAIDRLKYHLVRRRLLPELLEVLRFQREDLPHTPPLRVRGGWDGDYPFRGDPRLAVPDAIYRLGVELRAAAVLDALRWDGDELVVAGTASLTVAGAAAPGVPRVRVAAVSPGRLARVRRRLAPMRLRVTVVPEAAGSGAVGFEARLPVRRLRRLGRWRPRSLDLLIVVSNGGITRRFSKFAVAQDHDVAAVERLAGDAVALRAFRASDRSVRVRVLPGWAQLHGHRVAGEALELHGRLRLPGDGPWELELARHAARPHVRAPVTVVSGQGPRAFSVRVPLADLAGADVPPDDGAGWELWIADAGGRERVALAGDAPPGRWRTADAEIELDRTTAGDAALVVRPRGTDPHRAERIRIPEHAGLQRRAPLAP